MVFILYQDILEELKDRLVRCSPEEERKYVRKAHDVITARILEASKDPNSYDSDFYRKMYSIFNKGVEEIINGSNRRGYQSTLVTCPERRPARFFYPQHELCLDDAIWEVFHNQLRSVVQPERDSTVLLMCVQFLDGRRQCYVEENYDYEHAEIRALRKLENRLPMKIHMYISRSPCIPCIREIQDFMDRNYTFFNIRFSTVHCHYDPQEMNLLRSLRANIGVMSSEDWDHVEKHLTNGSYIRLRQEFEDMNGESSDTDEEDSETTASDVTESEEEYDNEDNEDNNLQIIENHPKQEFRGENYKNNRLKKSRISDDESDSSEDEDDVNCTPRKVRRLECEEEEDGAGSIKN